MMLAWCTDDGLGDRLFKKHPRSNSSKDQLGQLRMRMVVKSRANQRNNKPLQSRWQRFIDSKEQRKYLWTICLLTLLVSLEFYSSVARFRGSHHIKIWLQFERRTTSARATGTVTAQLHTSRSPELTSTHDQEASRSPFDASTSNLDHERLILTRNRLTSTHSSTKTASTESDVEGLSPGLSRTFPHPVDLSLIYLVSLYLLNSILQSLTPQRNLSNTRCTTGSTVIRTIDYHWRRQSLCQINAVNAHGRLSDAIQTQLLRELSRVFKLRRCSDWKE